jgi:hypothetical protein
VDALNKEKPGTLAKAFSTHPQTPDRLAKTRKEIDTVLPPLPEYKLDTSDFADMKAQLMQTQNHSRINGGTRRRPATIASQNKYWGWRRGSGWGRG